MSKHSRTVSDIRKFRAKTFMSDNEVLAEVDELLEKISRRHEKAAKKELFQLDNERLLEAHIKIVEAARKVAADTSGAGGTYGEGFRDGITVCGKIAEEALYGALYGRSK